MEYKPSAETGFVWEPFTATASVIRPEIKDTLCRKQLIQSCSYRTPGSLRPRVSQRRHSAPFLEAVADY